MTTQQPEALRLANVCSNLTRYSMDAHLIAAYLRSQHTEIETLRARVQELEAHLILDCMTHVQNPAEIEHVAGDVSKNWAESNMSTQPAAQQEAQEPVYAFRRKGLDDFCTCTEKRYAELSAKPNLFETRIFYTAPQPLPAYKDSTPELHVGDSAFESWYSAYSPAHKGDKQRARDAYAAGMGDPLVTAAPTAVARPSEALAPGKQHDDLFPPLPTPDLRDVGTTPKDIQDFLRGYATEYAKAALAAHATQPSPAAQEDALDAACQRACMELPEGMSMVIQLEQDAGWIELHGSYGDQVELPIADGSLAEQVHQAIDAARAAQEGK